MVVFWPPFSAISTDDFLQNLRDVTTAIKILKICFSKFVFQSFTAMDIYSSNVIFVPSKIALML